MTNKEVSPRLEQRVADTLILAKYSKEQIIKQTELITGQQTQLETIGENTYAMIQSLKVLQEATSTSELQRTVTENNEHLDQSVEAIKASVAELTIATVEEKEEINALLSAVETHRNTQVELNQTEKELIDSLSDSNKKSFESLNEKVTEIIDTLTTLHNELTSEGTMKEVWDSIRESLLDIEKKQEQQEDVVNTKLEAIKAVGESIEEKLKNIIDMSGTLDESQQLILARVDLVDAKVSASIPAEVK